ncbi:MAG: bile acid:sodium symporter family protein [Bacteroidota bacterium]
MSNDIYLPLALAFVMFGLGMTLEFKDFRHIFRYPRSAIVGLALQLLAPPLVAFALAFLFLDDPMLQVGLVVIAACPGGATSNLISHLLRGNVALSILLTMANSFVIVFSVPIIVNLALSAFTGQEQEIHLDFWSTVLEIFLSVMLPVLAGMLLRIWKPGFADKAEKPMEWLMPTVMFAVFVVVLLFGDEKNPKSNIPDFSKLLWPLLWAFILNVSGILAGFYTPKFLNVGFRARLTICIEVGVQNSLLALTISKSQLHSQEIAQMAIAYGSITFFTTFGLAWLLSKTTRKPFRENNGQKPATS